MSTVESSWRSTESDPRGQTSGCLSPGPDGDESETDQRRGAFVDDKEEEVRNKPDNLSNRNKDEASSALAELAKAETTYDNNYAVKAPAVRHDSQQSTAQQLSSVASGRQPEPLRRELLSKGSQCRSNATSNLLHCLPVTPHPLF